MSYCSVSEAWNWSGGHESSMNEIELKPERIERFTENLPIGKTLNLDMDHIILMLLVFIIVILLFKK
jgi:hypothetical protein